MFLILILYQQHILKYYWSILSTKNAIIIIIIEIINVDYNQMFYTLIIEVQNKME